MGLKLKHDFFRVNTYNPYVPMDEPFYAVENDNTFQIRKGDKVVATYSGFARGFGKILTAFNVEYCVYDDGAGTIRCIDNFERKSILINSKGDTKAMFCANNKLYLVRESGGNIIISEYIIVGNAQTPIVEKTNEHTMSVPESTANNYAAVKINESNVYFYRYATRPASVVVNHWVKVVISETDFEIKELEAEYPEITALQTIGQANTGFTFYNPLPLSALISVGYSVNDGWRALIRVYKQDDQIAEYKIPVSGYNTVPGVGKVFFDTDWSGNGYALIGSMTTSPAVVVSVYRLEGGSYRLLTSKTSGTFAAARPAGSYGQLNAYYPWYGVFCGFPYGSNSYISYKANATLTDITLTNAVLTTTTSNPDIKFGNMIKWL